MTNNNEIQPSLKQIIGSLLFAAREPLTVAKIKRVLVAVAQDKPELTALAKTKESQIQKLIEELRSDFREQEIGLGVSEVANGYRLENEICCGPWIRHLLERGKTQRLSPPALETLAVVAYRQPCTRMEIEAVRGVAVDQIVRRLLEMQLLRIVGRSELPGRPLLLGTTQLFLEHFGLKSLDSLPGVDELRRIELKRVDEAQKQAGEGGDAVVDENSEATAEQDAGITAEEEPAPSAGPEVEPEPEEEENHE